MQNPTFIVPIANSAGYAIDQIGMVFAYAREQEKLGHKINLKLCADERFASMVGDSAQDLSINVAHPYTRQNFPPGASITSGPSNLALTRIQASEHILAMDDIARSLHILDPQKYELVESPAGFVLANPMNWFQTDAVKAQSAKRVLDQAAEAARQITSMPDADVHFLFFFGGKSLTDSELDIDAKRVGGMVKSIGADDQIDGIRILQLAAKGRGQLIVPVFAQYGEQAALEARMHEFNQSVELITPITNLRNLSEDADWNNFEGPANIIAAAQQHYGAIVLGNGSTTQHLAAASVSQEAGLQIIVLRPPWSDLRGEDRWDAAARYGRIVIVTADYPAGISYEDIMQRVSDEPAEAAALIREASGNVSRKAYVHLIDRLPFLLAHRPKGNPPLGSPTFEK